MPFGKHRGEHLSTLPGEYVNWLLAQDFVKDPLRGALIHICNEPPERDTSEVGPRGGSYPPALEAYVRMITLEGYKACLKLMDGDRAKLGNLQDAREAMEEILGI